MKRESENLTHKTQIRVRYGETDLMGIVHHSSYILYLEEARTAMLRDLGYSYKRLEDNGVILPIYEVQIQYKKPAYYDDVLTVETTFEKISGVRIIFSYRIFNSKNQLLSTARTTLIFTDSNSFKPVRPPQIMLQLLSGD